MNKEESKVPHATKAFIKKKYIIKAKLLYTASSSSIITWLSIEESNFNEDLTSDKCLVWIGFRDEMEALYSELDQNNSLVSDQYIKEFRAINNNRMLNIYQITSDDIAQTMFWTIENVICSVIIRLEG